MSARLFAGLLLALPATALAEARLERAFGDDVEHVAFEARGDLEIVTGATPGLVVLAEDDEALADVEVRISDGRLTVREPEGLHGLFAWIRREPLDVRVIVRDLAHVEFAGSGDLRVSDVRGGALRVEIAGSANCVLEALDLDELRVEIAGSADCEVSGSAERQRVAIAGRANYRAFGLATARTEVEVSGMGEVGVHATEVLDAGVSGMGDVEYRGSPALNERISGLGSVARADGP